MISKAFASCAVVTVGRMGGVRRNWFALLALAAVVLAGVRVEAQSPFVAVRSTAVLPDGRIVIGGDFTNYNGVARARVARLNRDLSLDTTFDPALGPDGSVYAVYALGDGKVMIGGSFTNVAGVVRTRVARLNADGSLDVSFDPLGGPDGTVTSLATADESSWYIAGDFVLVDGFLRSGVAKLTANGGVDLSFVSGNGTDGPVNSVVTQTDGKVVIGGEFFSFNSTNRTRLARLNANGALDLSFDPGAGPDAAVAAMAIQADGKILVGGSFRNIGVNPRASVARLNANGTLDLTFDPGVGPNGAVRAVAVQFNGKILIGGDFSSVAGLTRGYIARLSRGGTNETAFSAGTGANAPLSALLVTLDGTILVGGAFGVFDGLPRTGVSLVAGEAPLQTCTLVGQVTDAMQSPVQTLSGVQVAVAGQVVTTDFLGNFSVTNVPVNAGMTLSASAPGYATYYTSGYLAAVPTNQIHFSITPQLDAGTTLRFVMNVESPQLFLDSHLLTPYPRGVSFISPHHVYSFNRGSSNSAPFASLDLYTQQFGPQTMSISALTNGAYDYYIEDRSFFAGIAGTGANVKAYTTNGLVASARVPVAGSPFANFWRVFHIDGTTRQISIINNLTPTDPDQNQFGAPNFSQQPQNATPRPGQSATFTATATGDPFGFYPVTYQWQFQGTDIPGATNTALNIPNAQFTNEGTYTITASNPYGSVTSSTVYLALRAGSAPGVQSAPSSRRRSGRSFRRGRCRVPCRNR